MSRITAAFKTGSIACLLFAAASAPLQAAQADHWLFQVYLDDRKIGYHEFTVTPRDGGHAVETQARFDVKFLFFNAYSYDHRNRETWAGDCLQDIDAVTNDNGTEYLVSGQSRANGFMLQVNRDSAPIQAQCVRSFAYWNPVILDAQRLLNSQTGEVVDVTVRPEGAVTLDIGPHRVAAEKYTLELEDGPIRLWYSPGGRHWLALEAETDGGRTLRYVPLELPWNAVTQTRLAMD